MRPLTDLENDDMKFHHDEVVSTSGTYAASVRPAAYSVAARYGFKVSSASVSLTDSEIVGQAADRFHDECHGQPLVPCESCGDYPADRLMPSDSLYCYLCAWSALEHGHLHGDD